MKGEISAIQDRFPKDDSNERGEERGHSVNDRSAVRRPVTDESLKTYMRSVVQKHVRGLCLPCYELRSLSDLLSIERQ